MSVNLLLIFFVLVVVAMIAIILVQKGTGATAGAAFGSGASSTVFGAKGSGNFLTKTTMMLAFLFFAISFYMAIQASKEFGIANSGEIDLGVVGTLDTSDSDVPVMNADDTLTKDEASDVPALDASQSESASDDQSGVPVIDNVEAKVMDMINKDADVTTAVEQKVDDIKNEAEDKAAELKDGVMEKATEVKEEVKDKINDQ